MLKHVEIVGALLYNLQASVDSGEFTVHSANLDIVEDLLYKLWTCGDSGDFTVHFIDIAAPFMYLRTCSHTDICA